MKRRFLSVTSVLLMSVVLLPAHFGIAATKKEAAKKQAEFTILNPRPTRAPINANALTPRLASLNGKTIAVLGNYNPIMAPLAKEMLKVANDVKIIFVSDMPVAVGQSDQPMHLDAPGVTNMSFNAFDGNPKVADAVVTGNGFCANAVSSAVKYAAKYDKLGIPACAIAYPDMASIGHKSAMLTDVASPEIRLVLDPTRGAGGTGLPELVAQCGEALTKPLTQKEQYSGKYELPQEPRVLFTGSYEDANAVLEGDLSMFTSTIGAAVYTDGSPVRLPTEEAVAGMLAGTSHKPDEVVGVLKPSMNPATVHYIAVNAVMAGCKPEYMPVLLAITEAMANTDISEALFGAHGWFRFGVVVNGPIAKEINLNSGGPGQSGPAPLTPGVPANTSISRFMRLMMINIAGVVPGVSEAKGLGNPAKTSFVIAEANGETPWPQLSTDWGFKNGENTVTFFVFWGDMLAGVRQEYRGPAPEGRAEKVMVNALGSLVEGAKGLSRSQQGLVIALSPQQVKALSDAGFSRQDAKQWFSDHCVDPFHEAKRMGLGAGVVGTVYSVQGVPLDPDGEWPPEWKDPNFDPNTIVKYYPNPAGINFIIFEGGRYSLIQNGTPRWTTGADKWK